MASILSLLFAWGIAAFWSFTVPLFGVGALLLLFVTIRPSIPLAQLFLQVVILPSKALHNNSQGLYLSFKGSAWFVSLVVVGRHRASKYHTTLCPGSSSMASTTFSLQTMPTDDAENRQ